MLVKMTHRKLRNRILPTLEKFRKIIEDVNPRPKELPANYSWSLAWEDVVEDGQIVAVKIIAHSVTRDMLIPREDFILGKTPWTLKGQRFFDNLISQLECVTGLEVKVTFVLDIWENFQQGYHNGQ